MKIHFCYFFLFNGSNVIAIANRNNDGLCFRVKMMNLFIFYAQFCIFMLFVVSIIFGCFVTTLRYIFLIFFIIMSLLLYSIVYVSISMDNIEIK